MIFKFVQHWITHISFSKPSTFLLHVAAILRAINAFWRKKEVFVRLLLIPSWESSNFLDRCVCECACSSVCMCTAVEVYAFFFCFLFSLWWNCSQHSACMQVSSWSVDGAQGPGGPGGSWLCKLLHETLPEWPLLVFHQLILEHFLIIYSWEIWRQNLHIHL